MSEAAAMPNVPAELRELTVLEALASAQQRLSRNQLSVRTGLSYYAVGAVLKDAVARDLVGEWDVPSGKRVVYGLTDEGEALMHDPHVCQVCGRVCADAEGLARHLNREHHDADEDLIHAPIGEDAGQDDFLEDEGCLALEIEEDEEVLADIPEESLEPQLPMEEPKAIVRYCQWQNRPGDESSVSHITAVVEECCPDFGTLWDSWELRIVYDNPGYRILNRHGNSKTVHFCPACGKRIEFQAVFYEFKEKAVEVLV